MEPCVQDASDSGEDVIPGPVSTWTLDSIHSDVYPFLDASPDSNSSVPADIFKEFTSVFSKKQSEKLPIHREFDCTIDLVPNAAPHHGKIYQLTREEDKVMQDWITENLAKGFIRNSLSPHGAPCFFVKQKDKLRLCMDYRGLNKIPSRIGIRFLSSQKCSGLSLLERSSLLWTCAELTIFCESRRVTNPKLRLLRIYLDDIVVYSENLEKHKEHVKSVLAILSKNGLYCKLEKFHFYQQEISYLGYAISSNGICMDSAKVKALQDWPTPRKLRDIQVLLGFANFYRTLIPDYSNMTCHLTKLLKKDAPFSWGADQEKSISDLKKAFSNSSFLAHPCDSKPFILETDASDFAISGVLSQFDDLDQIRPVAFYARQMNSAERNYEIYDKELLAIVDSFKHWRHLLQGGLHPVTVLCDHKSLEYFMSTKKLTRRQARWSLELSEYDFSITHRPGKLNGRADALSRQSDHHLENDCSNFKRILDPKQIIDLQSLISDMDLHVIVHSEVLKKVFVLESDWPLIIADFLAGEDNVWMDDIPEATLAKCKKELKNFRFRDDTFLRILEDGKSTATYVHYEQRSKCQLNQSASGIHSPLPIRPVPPVALPFERWGIDFYGPMAETKSGNRYLITCIDYATRWVLAKPVKEMTESAVAAFLYDLMMTYGAPFEIISDRGKSFLAEGIDLFERENKIRHLATTPYHPQTNGMVERMHAMLGHGLTTLTNESRDRWDEFLPQTLLALRTRTHAVTGFSPFYLMFGIHPRLPYDETPPRSSLAPLDDIEQMEENSEFIARNLEEVGQARSAANVRTKAQAEAMRKRSGFDENTPDYFFKVGDMVKMKHHDRLKLEFRWKGPYHVVDVGHPGTYWIMTSQGLRLPNAVNQNDLAPWLSPVVDNVDFFYDGTSRNSGSF
ncbi:hypothetical protein BASA83_003665 [Batrachochytrium salamandrivorans]|nr:hypothetical protein BASA83_003665 [Batrachochytrium salamandrivorans]